MLAGLAPFWASAGAAGCWVQGFRRRAPGSLALSHVFDVFWLLSFGSYVPAPARLAPPSSGPAVQGMSLRRSCVAYFLREFPAPCLR